MAHARFLIPAGLTLLLIPLLALAAELRVGERPSIADTERITVDAYLFGAAVTSAGDVRGDLIAGGGTVIATGDISGDAIVGGGNITLSGAVSDDVRAGGGNIVVTAEVGGDLVAVGGQTSLSGRVGGDLMWAGGMLRIDAPVSGSLRLAGGDVYINAPIGGSVEFTGERLTLGPGAVVAGDLTYASPKEAVLEAGSRVVGKTSFTEQKPKPALPTGGIFAILSALFLGKFLSVFACALVAGLVFRRFSVQLVTRVAEAPLLELGRGLVALIVWPVISVLMLATLIGIPLGFLGLLSFAVAMIFASITAPVVLGSVAYRWFSKGDSYVVSWKTVLLGVVLYFVLGLVPVVGWLALFALVLMTLGAALKLKWTLAKEWR